MEMVGWVSIGCLITAYICVTSGILSPLQIPFLSLNLVGSCLSIWSGWYRKYWQVVVINCVFGVISLLAIMRVLCG